MCRFVGVCAKKRVYDGISMKIKIEGTEYWTSQEYAPKALRKTLPSPDAYLRIVTGGDIRFGSVDDQPVWLSYRDDIVARPDLSEYIQQHHPPKPRIPNTSKTQIKKELTELGLSPQAAKEELLRLARSGGDTPTGAFLTCLFAFVGVIRFHGRMRYLEGADYDAGFVDVITSTRPEWLFHEPELQEMARMATQGEAPPKRYSGYWMTLTQCVTPHNVLYNPKFAEFISSFWDLTK
jgi:hypothetical protein